MPSLDHSNAVLHARMLGLEIHVFMSWERMELRFKANEIDGTRSWVTKVDADMPPERMNQVMLDFVNDVAAYRDRTA